MRDHPLRFLAGDCVLDFINTGGGDTKARDIERLNSFGDVITWALAAEVIDDDEANRLRELATASPKSANRCLQELRIQRESLFNFVIAVAEGRKIPETDRALLESRIQTALQHARLVSADTQPMKWHFDLRKVGMASLKYRLDLAASKLLTSPSGSDIRQCELCSWLFLDSSVSKRRRWCSMALCGNRVKAQRHYDRQR